MIKALFKFISAHGPFLALILLLLTWPIAWMYSSLGIDLETPVGTQVVCVFYRVRWPGDGSIMIGRIDEPLRAPKHPLERFDLGGVFFRPAMELHPASLWERLGFRWVNYDRDRDAGPCDVSPHAARVKLIGFPHGLIVLGWAALLAGQRRRSLRHLKNHSP
ncbi:hypothetical protein BH10PLA1_BH10PLA1_04120 [soil metagenome]